VKELRTRFSDSESRRRTLAGIASRLERERDERRFRELNDEIDGLFERGDAVPMELRSEHESLRLKLKG
jgi:hypothetical protein